MFGKLVIGSMFFIAVTSVAPQLGAILFIAIPIIIVVMQGKEEKAANTAEFGYDPIRQKIEDLPPEQQARVKEISDEKKIAKDQEIYQMCRNQKAIPGTMTQRLRGDPQYYPSLKQYQDLANKLPPALGSKLMTAARYESREYTKKKNLFIHEDDWTAARDRLVCVVKECNAF
jgi:hypothetical protein